MQGFGFSLDKLDLSMNLECLELGPLDCEHVKSPIPNVDCENNHVGNESKSHKNIRGDAKNKL